MKNRFLLVALLLLTFFRLSPAGAAPDFEAARLNAAAANPPGVSLTLSLPPGRTQFRQGEVIPLTAVFASSLPKAYRLNTGPGNREIPWNSDSFQVDDTTGAVDPLAAYYAQEFGIFGSGGGPQFQDLTAQAVAIHYALNEWLRFGAPGHYRVYLTSGRVIDAGSRRQISFSFRGRTATSNAVDLEILPRAPSLDAQALQQALPLYNTDGYDSRIQEARQAAVRTIRFLETPEAAQAMVARYGHYADYIHWNGSPAYYQTRLGLFGFPQPAVVIQEMERRLADPNFPVFNEFLYDLAQVQFFAAYPQTVPLTAIASPARDKERQRLLRRRLDARTALTDLDLTLLAAAVPGKQGKARAVSLYTLLQMADAHQSTAEQRTLAQQLIPIFDDLTPEQQNSLLDYNDWPQVHSPDLLPLLRRIFAGPPPEVESVAWQDYEAYRRYDLALHDLTQFSPTEGRTLLLAEIRSPTPRVDLPTLCSLPDRTLPALDRILATNLENSLQSPRGYRETEACLVERYATGAILPRVKAAYEGNEEKIGGSLLFDLAAYFLRTDRPYGVKEVEKALAERQGSGWYRSALSDVAALYSCPELEHLAIAHLHDPDPEVVLDAVKTLGTYGSAAAEAPLWARLREWHQQWAGKGEQIEPTEQNIFPVPRQLEYALTQALATAPGWLADRAKLQALTSLCVTEEACRNIASLLPGWAGPTRISFEEGRDKWSVAQYGELSSLTALENKLAQFPRGTQFRLSSWTFSSRMQQMQAFRQLKPFLEKRGMQIDMEPVPLHVPR